MEIKIKPKLEQVVVVFESNEDLNDFEDLIGQKITDNRTIWFHKKERNLCDCNYKSLNEAELNIIKAEYEAGLSSKSDIAQKWGISLNILNKHAKEKKWVFGWRSIKGGR